MKDCECVLIINTKSRAYNFDAVTSTDCAKISKLYENYLKTRKGKFSWCQVRSKNAIVTIDLSSVEGIEIR